MIIVYFQELEIVIKNILLAYCFLFLVLVFLGQYYKGKKKEKFYFRDIPYDLPIGAISYYDRGKISKKTIWFTLLDLVSRGYYRLSRTEDKSDYSLSFFSCDDLFELEGYDLKSFEKTLVKYINSLIVQNGKTSITIKELNNLMKVDLNLKRMTEDFYLQFRQYLKESYGLIMKEENYFWSFLVSFIYSFIILGSPSWFSVLISLFYSLMVVLLALVLKNFSFNLSGIIGVASIFIIILGRMAFLLPSIMVWSNRVGFLLAFVNPFLLIIEVLILRFSFYTGEQKKIVREIEGLKNFLNDFSVVEERELHYINLLERYYAVAVALDIRLDSSLNNIYGYDDSTFDTLNAMEASEYIAEIMFETIGYLSSFGK